MKNLIYFFAIFFLCSCNQNTDESIDQELFIDNALDILETLKEYYPPEDINLLFSTIDTNGFQTATFSLIGETKETIQLGSFAVNSTKIKTDGTTCTNKWDCGREIKKCLDNGEDALISNGACENSAWCVECVETD